MNHVRVTNASKISENTFRLMENVRAAMAEFDKPLVEKPEPNPNFVKFDEAVKSNRFSYYKMGLYKEADTDEDIGKIWHLKEYENPKTGEKEKWLVVYTDDNDELVRQLASKRISELKKTAHNKLHLTNVHRDSKGNLFGKDDEGTVWYHEATGFDLKENVRCYGCDHVMYGGKGGWSPCVEGGGYDWYCDNCVDLEKAGGESVQTPGAMDRLTSKTAGIPKAGAPPKQPNPKDVPLAPGIRSKNLTIDESGAAGTAKVTVEFTDVDEGLKFYQEQPENAGGGKGEEKPEEGEVEGEGSEEGSPEVEVEGQGQGSPQGKVVPSKTPGVPPVPPASPQGMIQPAQGSTVHKMTHYGQQAITVIRKVVADVDNFEPPDMGYSPAYSLHKTIERELPITRRRRDTSTDIMPHEKPKNWDKIERNRRWPEGGDQDPQGGKEDNRFENYKDIEASYYFINEDGKFVPLSWQDELRVGSQFERPDTGGMARVAGYVTENYVTEDSLVNRLITVAKKPYFCETCESGFTEGQMNFHKNHEYTKGGEKADSKEEEKTETKEEEKEESPEKEEAEKEEGTEKESALQVDAKCPTGIPKDVKKKVVKEYGKDNPKTYQTLNKIKKEKKSDLSLEFTKEAADVSDEIPPMGWNNDETGQKPAGAGPALPPNQDLQTGNPTQPAPNVLYDSKQDSGPQFQTTIDPKDKSVKIKFIDSGAAEALQGAVQAPQAPLPNPAQPPPGAPPAGGPQPPPGAGGAPQGKGGFSQQEVPTEF